LREGKERKGKERKGRRREELRVGLRVGGVFLVPRAAENFWRLFLNLP